MSRKPAAFLLLCLLAVSHAIVPYIECGQAFEDQKSFITQILFEGDGLDTLDHKEAMSQILAYLPVYLNTCFNNRSDAIEFLGIDPSSENPTCVAALETVKARFANLLKDVITDWPDFARFLEHYVENLRKLTDSTIDALKVCAKVDWISLLDEVEADLKEVLERMGFFSDVCLKKGMFPLIEQGHDIFVDILHGVKGSDLKDELNEFKRLLTKLRDFCGPTSDIAESQE